GAPRGADPPRRRRERREAPPIRPNPDPHPPAKTRPLAGTARRGVGEGEHLRPGGRTLPPKPRAPASRRAPWALTRSSPLGLSERRWRALGRKTVAARSRRRGAVAARSRRRRGVAARSAHGGDRRGRVPVASRPAA